MVTKKYLAPAVVDQALYDCYKEFKNQQELSGAQVIGRALDLLFANPDTPQYYNAAPMRLRIDTSKISVARYITLETYCEDHNITVSQGVRTALALLTAPELLLTIPETEGA